MKSLFGRAILEYLKFWAKLKLRRIHPKIIGVTGSVGKTGAIHAIHTVLSGSYNVRTTFKGNSESGIPLEILGVRLVDFSVLAWLKAIALAPIKAFERDAYDVLVVEMGVDAPYAPKNMQHLLTIVRPDIGVILNIASVHTEQFAGDVSAIAGEKGKLVTTMGPTGCAIINSDDIRLRELIPAIQAKLRTFGWNKSALLRFADYSLTNASTKFTFEWNETRYALSFKNQLYFRDYIYTFASALLVGNEMGIPLPTAIGRLQKEFRLPPGRLSVLVGEKGSTLIDGSYNASPSAMTASLQLLKDVQAKGKKIAVLGDMRELGDLTEAKHREIGKYAGQAADEIVLVGPLMKRYALPEIIASGFPKENIFHFDTAKDVGQFLLSKRMKRHDLILMKGSQNTIFLEQVVYELMNDKENAHDLLCRQSSYWSNVRKKFFAKTEGRGRIRKVLL